MLSNRARSLTWESGFVLSRMPLRTRPWGTVSEGSSLCHHGVPSRQRLEPSLTGCSSSLDALYDVLNERDYDPYNESRPPSPIRWQRILADVTGGAVGNMA